MQDWRKMSACDLGRGIVAGEIDPIALTEEYLAAIDAHPARDRIYSAVTAGRARAEAAAASERARAGLRLSLLDGVPISWKDLFDSAGVATEAGSALLKGRVPARDATVLEAATRAGLVCLGKVHMSELAFSGLGLNPSTATPPCVNDPGAVPGGSSSGSGASVAHGLAAASIGSDTGGSVRIPSAWNDLVGLKTTAGRVAKGGVVPLCARFDTVGPLARSVEDCAHLLAVMEGGTPADLRGAEARGLRLAVLRAHCLEETREAPLAAFDDALARVRAAGAEITEVFAPEVDDAMPLSGILFTSEAYGTWADMIEAAPDKMFAPILERFRSGKDFLASEFVAAWQTLDALRVQWEDRFAGFDAVLLPTAPILPPNAERLMTDDAYYVTENLLALRNTRVGNLMGLSAMSLPTDRPSCGMMVFGKAFGEEALMRVCAAMEPVVRGG